MSVNAYTRIATSVYNHVCITLLTCFVELWCHCAVSQGEHDEPCTHTQQGYAIHQSVLLPCNIKKIYKCKARKLVSTHVHCTCTLQDTESN